ncbi:aspartate/glutamate racemase family protein [Solwaraspora sp. WMMB335]|uniref:aspartate/glutamate racemase family protein n=1 Tax=Solwaraspora sp. WMMB335 TaxID=3404118 RepID=UPI003B946B33
MRIWFQKHTVAGRNPWLDQSYLRHAEWLGALGAQVDFHTLPEQTYQTKIPADHVRFGQLEVLFSWYFADQAVTAERAGYDAYVIGTSQDPGLAAARSLVSIPVVGYGQVATDFLRTQRLRFGVLGFVPALEEILRENIADYGYGQGCVGFRYLPHGRMVVEAGAQPQAVARLRAEMDRAAAELRELGAQIIVPGEGIPNELLCGAGIRELGGLPFLDANALVLSTAYLHAFTRAQGVWHRDVPGYHTGRAPVAEVDRLRALFAPAVTSCPGASPKSCPTGEGETRI